MAKVETPRGQKTSHVLAYTNTDFAGDSIDQQGFTVSLDPGPFYGKRKYPFAGWKRGDGGNIIPRAERINMPESFKGLHILEMGNKGNQYGLYRDEYMMEGAASYNCVDLNGEDGAHPIDLRSETAAARIQDATGIKSFDFITNIGTSEHVPVQRTFWKACHELSHVGTEQFHWVPHWGKMHSHGRDAGAMLHIHWDFPDTFAKYNTGLSFIKDRNENDPDRKRMHHNNLGIWNWRVDKIKEFVWLEEWNKDLFWYNDFFEQSWWGMQLKDAHVEKEGEDPKQWLLNLMVTQP